MRRSVCCILLLVLSTHACALAQQVIVPENGRYRIGEYLPVRVIGVGAIELRGKGIITTRAMLVSSESTVPVFVYGPIESIACNGKTIEAVLKAERESVEPALSPERIYSPVSSRAIGRSPAVRQLVILVGASIAVLGVGLTSLFTTVKSRTIAAIALAVGSILAVESWRSHRPDVQTIVERSADGKQLTRFISSLDSPRITVSLPDVTYPVLISDTRIAALDPVMNIDSTGSMSMDCTLLKGDWLAFVTIRK